MTLPVALEIDHRWSGERLPPEARSRVELRRLAAGLEVCVDAAFHDDPPPPSPPGWTDGLWRHEVVELFIAGRDGYLELELGPFGHHLALFFPGVRVRDDRRLALSPFEFARAVGRWRARVLLPSAWLPAEADRAAAFAIHGLEPHRTHLVSHPLPGAKPDFHQPEAFPRLGPLR